MIFFNHPCIIIIAVVVIIVIKYQAPTYTL